MKLCNQNTWTSTLTFINIENVVKLVLFVLLWQPKIWFDQWSFYFSVHGDWQRNNIYLQCCCSWDMACDRCDYYFSFWAIFCPFTPLTAQKFKIKKNEKIPGYIIILHKCTKNHDNMLYSSWDIARDRCNCYFSFWAIFCTFTT